MPMVVLNQWGSSLGAWGSHARVCLWIPHTVDELPATLLLLQGPGVLGSHDGLLLMSPEWCSFPLLCLPHSGVVVLPSSMLLS